MKAPINDKTSVLETLRVRLRVAESHLQYRTTRTVAEIAVQNLREAIRFIEEHAE